MSIDFYRIMVDARHGQNAAWNKYERLASVSTATAEERLSAVRAALAADEKVKVAEYNWRSINDLPT